MKQVEATPVTFDHLLRRAAAARKRRYRARQHGGLSVFQVTVSEHELVGALLAAGRLTMKPLGGFED